MTHIDHFEKLKKINRISHLEKQLEDEGFNLFCDENQDILRVNNLSPGQDFDSVRKDNVLISDSPVDRCVFDKKTLKRVACFIGGSTPEGDYDQTTIYQCPKCKVKYLCPPNSRDVKMLEEDDRRY